MKYFVVVAALLLPVLAQAEEGLVVQVQITEQGHGSDKRTGITSAVLMRLNEEVRLELGEMYVLKIAANQMESEGVSLLLTLKDIVEGRPFYVGAKSLRMTIGDQSKFSFERDGNSYEIGIDTSYGTIPESEG
ncbi:MAG: hypothetical protein AAF545_14115 [Pseudomonadota bacterium]